MKKKWWKEAVAYQIYPRSFKDSDGDGIGDIQGIISKLDYLKDLGVDVIWVCPMYQSPNDDNGYDISDYQAIMKDFGDMEDSDQLLDEVHKRGMKIILDLVINHTSDEHEWFIESKSSKDNPKRDWYIWADGKDGREPNNWESIFSGPAWQWDEETGQYFMRIFSSKQPDLNWENKEVREELYKMVNWWLDKGIDGFRVDAISHIKKLPGFPDMPNPENKRYVNSMKAHLNCDGIQDFLKEMKKETLSKYDIMTVGEANGVSVDQSDDWVGEENGVFNMIFHFEHLGIWQKRRDPHMNLFKLKETMEKWQKGLHNKGWNALFVENHDQPRSVSSWGNEEEYWEESAKAIAAMYFFMQGTPFIYQGQEIGMTNIRFNDINQYNDVSALNYYKFEKQNGQTHDEIMEVIWNGGRDNSRTPMQWDQTKNGGFSTADKTWIGVNPNYEHINVADQLKNPDSVLNFYKAMIRLRKENKGLVYGDFNIELRENEQIFMYRREWENKKYWVVVNMSDRPANFEFTFPLGTEIILENGIDNPTNILFPYEARVYDSLN